MTFSGFSQKFFRELGYNFFYIKLEVTISLVRLFQGTLGSCDFFLPPNMTVQNLAVFQIWRFLQFFLKKFYEN